MFLLKYTQYKGLCLHLESDLNDIMYSSFFIQPIISERWEIKQDKLYADNW